MCSEPIVHQERLRFNVVLFGCCHHRESEDIKTSRLSFSFDYFGLYGRVRLEPSLTPIIPFHLLIAEKTRSYLWSAATDTNII